MLKSVLRPVVRWRPAGEVLSRALLQLGYRDAASRVYRMSKSRGPSVIHLDLSSLGHSGSLRMHNRPVEDHVARMAWFSGCETYERPLPGLMVAAAKQSRVIVDVGANTGFFGSLMALTAGPSARIYACEPLPVVADVLKRNVELNDLADRITVVTDAVSDSIGTAQFYVPTNTYGVLEHSASLNATFRPEHSEVLNVPTITLDALRQRIDAPIDLLKIDVESHEHRVLIGGKQVFTQDRPIAVLEVLPVADTAALDALRTSYAYDVYHILEGGLRRVNQLVYSEESPNQLICPTEKAEHLRTIAASAGITCEQ